MYLFNGICLTDNLVKNLHRKVHPETDFSGVLSVIVLFQNRNFAYQNSYNFRDAKMWCQILGTYFQLFLAMPDIGYPL